MIEYLKGELTELEPTRAIIECGGVGYCCNISVYTYDKLKKGEVQKLYIAESIREDAHVLYGFISKQERALYELLISVSGVGPGTARCILSSLSPDELVAIVASANDRQLRNVKGLGPKTAQRIIVDLKDKVGNLGITAASADDSAIVASNKNGDEAVQALVALGYPMANASKAVSALLSKDPGMSVQSLIKQGLHMM
ncbi:MAG: Holliday junction branch migration protein RuvA [Bacteroidales bacterium]|nr:Holliday junction branch migration protein RuvA [Bacteroidales bacterium]